MEALSITRTDFGSGHLPQSRKREPLSPRPPSDPLGCHTPTLPSALRASAGLDPFQTSTSCLPCLAPRGLDRYHLSLLGHQCLSSPDMIEHYKFRLSQGCKLSFSFLSSSRLLRARPPRHRSSDPWAGKRPRKTFGRALGATNGCGCPHGAGEC